MSEVQIEPIHKDPRKCVNFHNYEDPVLYDKLHNSHNANEKKKMWKESMKQCDAIRIRIKQETHPAEACSEDIFQPLRLLLDRRLQRKALLLTHGSGLSDDVL
jgi:hypothetical protein